MKKTSKRILRTVLEWLAITAGCVLYSVGISFFLDPNGLAPGGVSGIAILIHSLTGFPTGIMILVINIPLMIAGRLVIGRGFLIKTVFSLVLSSVMIDVIPKLWPVPITTESLLAALFGGLLMAVGMGIIFRCGGSTGGTDIVIRLIRKHFRSVKTGVVMLIVDSLIVAASAVVFKQIEIALYAGIALCVNSLVVDKILYDTGGGILLIIISRRPEAIADRLMNDIDAGVTITEGRGAYTGEDKNVILCVVKKQIFHKAKDLVKEEDPTSFMIVTNASEVFGEGYKPHGAEEL